MESREVQGRAATGRILQPQEAQPMLSKPLDSLNSVGFDGSPQFQCNTEPAMKKKRGRPRKYAPDGNIALQLAPTTPIANHCPDHGGSDSVGLGSLGDAVEPPPKRNRGRPPGSGKRQIDALGGVSGVGFTPRVITVNACEDITSKITAFSQQGPHVVCILSANGAVCNVTLRQSGGMVKYEGRFEIISLSGSFLVSENNGSCSRSGRLNVSLAGSDGRVVGGGVAGTLQAATPVQLGFEAWFCSTICYQGKGVSTLGMTSTYFILVFMTFPSPARPLSDALLQMGKNRT
ncbi:AT-hook motif nuclear-localized protein 13 [Hibiscus syriacus]|uniref:AT-hook motif nuclear-localized protein n=1 Tax=Hibiscus syriacus TaxID=106335 RepID=A0A6A3CJU1_HIBSY|nr:AT-hook motif nuclear-localized protein 13 [Hibiscus syriacus]